ALSAAASRSGRACARSAAAPAAIAADTLVPLTVAYRGEPSSLRPGSEVSRSTPEARSSGLGRPSNARPVDVNSAAEPYAVFGRNDAAPTESPTVRPLASSCRTRAATSDGTPTTGTAIVSSLPRAPGGTGPSTRTAAAPAT